jgi:hypothetical protein
MILRDDCCRSLLLIAVRPRNSTIRCFLLYFSRTPALPFPMVAPRPGSNPKPPSASTRRPTAPPLPATTHHPLPATHSLFVSPLFSYSYELLFSQPLYFDNHPHCPPVWGYKPPISLRALCLRAAACPDLVGAANPLLSGICHLFPVSLRSFLHSLPLFSIVCSLFPRKHPGGGYPRNPDLQTFKSRPSYLRAYRMSLLLVPSYFADSNRFCIPSPIVPVPPSRLHFSTLQEAPL